MSLLKIKYPLLLNGKKYKSILKSENGEVSSGTVFYYRQNKNIIWATYEDGSILFGTVSGKIENNKLIFTYQHQNNNGEFKTDKCISTIEIANDKIRLIEE